MISFTVIFYFSIVVINVLYILKYFFDYIMLIIVMVMPCGIISYITCIIYFLCKILVVCGIKCIISLNYIVCVIGIVITCLV